MNKQLISVLTDVFGLRASQIVPELTKDQVGSWDSLKQMDLVMSLEREFDISLEITDIVKLNSVANINEVLIEKGVKLEA
ncbi:MAG: acyl carrier protein [Herminiimonas sp.]|uniref:acyl carrier protein n=1 Tax=Herminiimonas sp. TaxID=1926289 RepID=UPI0027199AE7|nr:acyl carrier protein [Herminiimonas sp.]MDO9419803.1 acyl carrier protein [Herminiimonas sp.]